MAGLSYNGYGRITCPYCASNDCVGINHNGKLICCYTRKIYKEKDVKEAAIKQIMEEMFFTKEEAENFLVNYQD